MLTATIVVVHVLVSLMLILLILLHSGRGGGLSDMFGGGMGTSAAGSTVMERNLDRITVGVAAGALCRLGGVFPRGRVVVIVATACSGNERQRHEQCEEPG